MSTDQLRLSPEQLRAVCRPERLGFETTAELPEVQESIGQERALAAIDLGLDMRSPGYNIFAAGPTGTGRMFSVVSRAREAAARRSTPGDWCYVHNYDDPRQPVALHMTAGSAPGFAREVEELVRACRQEIPRAFETDDYERRKEEAIGEVQAERTRVLRALDQEARAEGLMIQATPMGIITVPLAEGKPMSREQFEALPDEAKEALNRKMEAFRERIAEGLSEARQLEKEARRRVDDLDRQIAFEAIGGRFGELKARYKRDAEVVAYLDRMARDMVEHLEDFRPTDTPAGEVRPDQEVPVRYRVNVLVTNQPGSGAPVIQEQSPTYYNLVGKLEYRPVAGGAVTDFTLIKPGAFHRANGGYLILRALDVLLNPFAWEALKRTLRSQQAAIENIGEQWTPIPAAALLPEPIPLQVKVILVGSALLYFLLYYADEDFGKLFKVRADFDVDMPAGDEAYRSYGAFVATHCRAHGLRQLTKEGVARVVEYGMRLAADQGKLSTRFASIADLLAEADYWAGQAGAELIAGEHVDRALEEKEYRSRRLADRLFEFIARGDLIVEVAGLAVGQVNGLAVMEMGDYAFGRPSRITCQVTPGRAGLVNIEREARLAGNIHHKAVMILTGYLAGAYASEAPLSLTASLSFEQSYDLVEGDSASCAELYAILSALSGIPLRQSVAVTGSMDQKGNAQPVGGLNQKIEGFYTACRLRGLTGDQGVIVPRQNVKNLMLKPAVVDAVREGRFHIWAISHVDEGLEILTGVRAGTPQEPDTVHGRVAQRLRKFADTLAGAREISTTHIIELPPGASVPRPPTPPPPPIPPHGPDA